MSAPTPCAQSAVAGRGATIRRARAWASPPALVGAAALAAGARRSISLFPNYLGFGTELLITILFALSLDLVLGYAGIVTLGHAAFFGAGAYTVGMLAMHGIWTEPITGLIARCRWWRRVVGLASGLVLLRTTGLTLLMLTLCTMALLEEAANMGHDFTGGFDGLHSLPIPPLFGMFEFDPLYSNTQYLYVARRPVRLLRVRAHAGLFAVRPEPDRHPREHAAHARGRRAGALRGWSSATRSRRRSPASPAGCGRRPTPTST